MITEKLIRTKLLLMDVDGVLTNGKIIYTDKGYEIKEFNVKDGLGIKLLIDSGIYVGIITTRSSKALIHRCKDLGINYLKDSVADKVHALEEILKETNIAAENITFIGDDLPDLSVMTKVGCSVAVADADIMILDIASFVTRAKGGEGAVRELAELILRSKGKWNQIVKRFLK